MSWPMLTAAIMVVVFALSAGIHMLLAFTDTFAAIYFGGGMILLSGVLALFVIDTWESKP